MWHVLRAKFTDSQCAEALLATGNAFLLEHNSRSGRDMIWSDNEDGQGQNWLGLQLMLLRDEKRNHPADSPWDFLQRAVDPETGEPGQQFGQWKSLVSAAARAVRARFPAFRPSRALCVARPTEHPGARGLTCFQTT